jgi:diaminopimelate epimerase
MNLEKYRYYIMNGAGNRFIMVLLSDHQKAPNKSQIYKMGALLKYEFDQAICIKKKGNNFSYTVLNKDGSEAEQCGNGARCAVELIMNTYKTNAFLLSCNAGKVDYTKRGGEIGISLGKALNHVPTQHTATAENSFIQIKNQKIAYHFVSLGNPHAVIFDRHGFNLSLSEIAKEFIGSGFFPEGVNVGLGRILDSKNIELKVYERGAGETLACGTGAAAAAITAINFYQQQNPTTIHMRGGNLEVEISEKNKHVWLFGPTKIEKDGAIAL